MDNPARKLILPLLLLTLLLAAACGPIGEGVRLNSTPVSPAGQGGAAPVETGDGENAVEEVAAELGVERPVTEIAASGETDAQGIPVGFTAEGRAYRGDPNAPVVMEEFSDFQCPFCARFSAETLPSLLENQIAAGDVLLIYYDFPLENIHPQAVAAANAARCAGDQSAVAFWDMHDLLYADVDAWAIDAPQPVFQRYGEQLGLDMETFVTCVENEEHADAVREDLALGQSRGVNSTPSFFLNDQPLVGAQPLAAFNQAIARVQSGETLAVAEPEPAGPPLEAPRVAPTPVAIAADNVAFAVGDPDAPVTMVEFTDYQCPFCRRYSQETMPQVLSQLVDTGDVYYMLKDLPLDGLHPEARDAATAARCAGEQDAYLEMHDAIFSAQDTWAGQGEGANAIFAELAGELDLDTAAFTTCLESGRYDAVIQANVDEAFSFNAQATPYFFIDGFPVSGAQPFELFAYAVELAKAGELAAAYVPPEPDLSEAHSIGDANAPVTIIEYTDFQCPFCARHFEQTFPQIKANYIDTGQVRYIFKDFPLTNIHPQAVLAAQAARCAGDQDAYLEMHNQLFASQAEWNGRNDAGEIFTGYAAELGLDQESFAACLNSGQYEAAVMADLEEGTGLGINGTPAFFINGYAMSGAQPYPIFEQAIEQVLSEAAR